MVGDPGQGINGNRIVRMVFRDREKTGPKILCRRYRRLTLKILC
jgi:hypothetical protein